MSRARSQLQNAYLVLFPSTLESLADKRYIQFDANHFTNWQALSTSFCEPFRPSNSWEHILNQLKKLELWVGETFAKLMTLATTLVNKMPAHPEDFMVRKSMEKA